MLTIDGVQAEELARRFGTPLYVYSKRAILERFWSLKGAFRSRAPLICYALKANPNRGLAGLLAAEGAGADIVSGGELQRALAAGFPASRIVFSGVGKTEAELEMAVRNGLLTINMESRGEMELLIRVARRLRRRAAISIRLNPDVEPGTHPHVTTGRADNKFGVERGEALALFRKAAKSRWLSPRGVQCHIGSQITQVGPFRKAAAAVASLLRRLEGEGIPLELIDLGGGLGIPYKEEDGALGLPALAEALTKALAPWPKARLLLEPGRYLVADAGVLLTRVIYRKRTAKRRFVIVDAAMNDLCRPALYGAYHPIEPARRRPGRREIVDVVGPVCETGDFLARERRMAPCRPGDVLAVLKAGAYGSSMSSQYNSRPRAAEVLIDGGKARLIRRRETLEDITRLET